MSIYNTISYSTQTFPEGTYWTEISSWAYGSQNYVDEIISFNYADVDEDDRWSTSLSKEYSIKIPDLSEEFFDTSALPPWRQ